MRLNATQKAKALKLVNEGGWDESKHPRAEDGKFGTGSGSGGGGSDEKSGESEAPKLSPKQKEKGRAAAQSPKKEDQYKEHTAEQLSSEIKKLREEQKSAKSDDEHDAIEDKIQEVLEVKRKKFPAPKAEPKKGKGMTFGDALGHLGKLDEQIKKMSPEQKAKALKIIKGDKE